MSEPPRLDGARRELVRLGYLSHRFERFLLQDALVARGRWRGLVALAAKIGVAAGALLVAVNTLALGAANGLLGEPLELAVLFVHLAVPVWLGTALGFLAVVATFRLFLAAFPRRGLDWARVGAALGAATAVVGGGAWLGWEFLRGLPAPARVAAAALLPLVAGAVAKLLADGLLAFEIRWTRHVPHERLVSRRTIARALVASAVAVGAGALLVAPPPPPPPAAALPTGPGQRVLLVGIDGVVADELDFLLGSGALPAIERLARERGIVAAYARDMARSPAELWTTIATGREPADHGVVALDGYRLLGGASTLARIGPWRLWFGRVAAPLGLAEHRPLLAGRRRAPAIWELVARGGRPVAAINWWGTFPPEPLAGVVVAPGAGARREPGAPAAVAPAERLAAIAALRARRLEARGEPAAAQRLVEQRALAPDDFYRAVAGSLAAEAQALAVYLPAIDLAAATGVPSEARMQELVRAELVAADRLIAELGDGFGMVAVVVDPGRRGGGEGRVLIAGADCAAPARPRIAPAAIASALARAAGLPQSAELPPPPDFCDWPQPPARVATYGARRSRHAAGDDAAGYLETLRSLGYL